MAVCGLTHQQGDISSSFQVLTLPPIWPLLLTMDATITYNITNGDSVLSVVYKCDLKSNEH